MNRPTASSTGSPPRLREPSPPDLFYLRTWLRDHAAIEVGAERSSLWASRLLPIVGDHGLSDLASLVRALRMGDRALENAVIDAMTTHETSFFRDGPTFDDIAAVLIPRLLPDVPKSRPLTVWCSAASSGQEVYSLAMKLAIDQPDLVRAGRVRLLATDISEPMVKRCRSGRYSDLEVRRGLSDAMLTRFFDRRDDCWVVRPQIRDLVLCRRLNLVDSLTPVPQTDLVLIRNVLIYFSDPDKIEVLRNIKHRVLRPSGALVMGASEMLGAAACDYIAEDLPHGVCYRPRP